MIDFKSPPLHPTDNELANFINNRIIGTRKEEIEEHLVYCDECMDVVAGVMNRKQQEQTPTNKPEWFNNINIIASGLVASLLLFLLLPNQNQIPFIEFYTKNQEATFLAPTKVKIKNIKAKNQELNDFLKELTKNIDMSYLAEYKKAKNYLEKGDFDNARESYCMVLIDIEESNLNKIEKAKQSIFVNYQILLLSIKEGDQESSSEYKDIIKDNIRRLKIKEKSTF